MPHSSSKRGRDEAVDKEDTASYPGNPHPGAPTIEEPLPQRDPPETVVMETPVPSPLQLREEARIAFLAQPLLLEPNQLELNHVSALLALMVEGEWSATVVRLLARQSPKKKASAIWTAWKPYLAHPHHTRRVKQR